MHPEELTTAKQVVSVLFKLILYRLEEDGAVTDCRIKTQEPEEILDFEFSAANVVNKLIMKVRMGFVSLTCRFNMSNFSEWIELDLLRSAATLLPQSSRNKIFFQVTLDSAQDLAGLNSSSIYFLKFLEEQEY